MQYVEIPSRDTEAGKRRSCSCHGHRRISEVSVAQCGETKTGVFLHEYLHVRILRRKWADARAVVKSWGIWRTEADACRVIRRRSELFGGGVVRLSEAISLTAIPKSKGPSTADEGFRHVCGSIQHCCCRSGRSRAGDKSVVRSRRCGCKVREMTSSIRYWQRRVACSKIGHSRHRALLQSQRYVTTSTELRLASPWVRVYLHRL